MSRHYPVLHQVLHGYQNGHRLLASSIDIDKETGTQMQVLSDLLSAKMLLGSETYLTGYPLKSLNLFAVARTWAALDIERPGAVWTQTLLLDYALLGNIEDLSVLGNLFLLPTIDSLESYSAIKEIDIDSKTSVWEQSDTDDRAPLAINQLYGAQRRDDVVLPNTTSLDNEALTWKLWSQMWPALRRNLSFCTRPDAKLPKVNSTCQITFTSTPHSVPDIVNTEAIEFHQLTDDFQNCKTTALRSFLARYAVDVPDARLHVPILVNCYLNHKQPNIVASNLSKLISEGGGMRRLGKDILLMSLSDERLPSNVLLDTISEFRDIENFVSEREIEQINFIDRGDYEEFLPALISNLWNSKQDSLGGLVFRGVVESAPIKKLVSSTNNSKLKQKLFLLRPEVCKNSYFWKQKNRQPLLDFCLAKGAPINIVFKALQSDLTMSDVDTLSKYYSDEFLTLLAKFLKRNQASTNKYDLKNGILNMYPEVLSELETLGKIKHLPFVETIAEVIVTNNRITEFDFGHYLSTNKKIKDLSKFPHLVTLVFLTSLVEGDNYYSELLERTFDSVVDALRAGELPQECLKHINSKFRMGRKWLVHDQIIISLVKRFGGFYNLDPKVFNITNSIKSKEAIVSALYYESGASGLRKLLKKIENSSIRSKNDVIELVNRKLNQSFSFWSFSDW